MLTLGDRIISLRQDLDIQQKDLAAQIGITKSSMSKYERNINIPNAEILSKIADALNTTTDFLLGRTPSKQPLSSSLMRLSTDEQRFLQRFGLLNDQNRARILERIDTYYETQMDDD